MRKSVGGGKCPGCGKEVSAGAVICVSCGYDFRTRARTRTAVESQPGSPAQARPHRSMGTQRVLVGLGCVLLPLIAGSTIVYSLVKSASRSRTEQRPSPWGNQPTARSGQPGAGPGTARSPSATQAKKKLSVQPTRAAIVTASGQNAPQGALTSQLEVSLSRIDGLTLVERNEVGKVLKEQVLSLSGLVAPESMIKVGEVLSADMLIFVDSPPPPSPSSESAGQAPAVPVAGPPGGDIQARTCVVSVVETKTGIVLASLLWPADSLARDPGPAISAVCSAAEKLHTPSGSRHYVGVLGFRNEEPGSYLEGMADAFDVMVSADIAESPKVIVLDRRHLEHLMTEKNLAGAEIALKASALAIECGLKRNASGALDVTVNVRPVAGGPPRVASLSVDTKDISGARRMMAQTILKQIGEATAEVTTGTIEEEAALFAKRGATMSAAGLHERAAMDYETAMVIKPDSTYRVEAARAWEKLAHQLFWLEVTDAMHHAPGSEARTQRKSKMFGALLRESCLYREPLLQAVAEHKRNPSGKAERLPFFPVDQAHVYQVWLDPDEKEAWQLRRELALVKIEVHRASLAFYAQAVDAGEWWAEVAHLYQPAAWSGDFDLWAQLVHEAVALVEAPPAEILAKPHAFLTETWFIDQFSSSLSPCEAICANRRLQGSDKKIRETLLWMSKHNDPVVQIAGLMAKVNMSGGHDPEARRDALKVLARMLSEKGGKYQDNASIAHLSSALLDSIPDPGEKSTCAKAFIGPIVSSGNVNVLLKWRSAIERGFKAMEEEGRGKEAGSWAMELMEPLGKGLAALPEPKTPQERDTKARMENLIGFLETKRSVYDSTLVKRSAAAWADYDVKKLDILPPETCVSLWAAAPYKDRLVLCWTSSRKASPMVLAVTSVPAAGGEQVLHGATSLEKYGLASSGFITEGLITHFEIKDEAVFIGIKDGGIAVCENGEIGLWKEEGGLPSLGVSCIAFLGRKMLMGFGDLDSPGGSAPGALAECGLEDGNITLIASARTLEGKGPFDGGKPYAINGMVSDPKRGWVWLAADGKERSGLWKYHPDRREFEHALQVKGSMGSRGGLGRIAWSNEKLLALDAENTPKGVRLIDPDSLKSTWLIGGEEPKFKKKWKGYGATPFAEELWPVLPLGEHLFAGGRGIFLHTGPEEEGMPWVDPDGGRPLGTVSFLLDVGGVVYAGSVDGDILRIRPKRPAQ